MAARPPPALLRTKPMRRFTTRIPLRTRGVSGGFPGFGHLRKKQRARGTFLVQHLVIAVAVVTDCRSGHQHLGATAQMRKGFAEQPRALDPASRMRDFFSGVHRPTMVSPARCTTASKSSRSSASMMPAPGSHKICRPSAGDLVRRTTMWPSAVKKVRSALTDQSAGTCQENAHRRNLQPAGERRGGSWMRKAFSPSQPEAHNTSLANWMPASTLR